MARKVIINQSNGTPMQEIETNALTWGELQVELDNAGIRYSGMKAIIGETRNTLESNRSTLPLDGIFNVFLLPKKTKSGLTKTKDMTKSTTKKTETKSTTKKTTPTKKVAIKKDVIVKTAPEKKTESKGNAIAELAAKAIKNVEKGMNDVDIIVNCVNSLRTIKNTNVQTKLSAVIIELDDISYIAATGKPRIDNLKSKRSACELMQDNNLGLRQDC